MFNIFGNKGKARAKAAEFITIRIGMQLDPYIKFIDFIQIVKDDAYVAGFISGEMTASIAYFNMNGGLPLDEGNMVSGMVLMAVFGEKALPFSQAIKAHQAARTPEFVDGSNKGDRLVWYGVGTQDVFSDPDYTKAIDACRRFERQAGLTGRTDRLAAIEGFEVLWLHEYMGKYK